MEPSGLLPEGVELSFETQNTLFWRLRSVVWIQYATRSVPRLTAPGDQEEQGPNRLADTGRSGPAGPDTNGYKPTDKQVHAWRKPKPDTRAAGVRESTCHQDRER